MNRIVTSSIRGRFAGLAFAASLCLGTSWSLLTPPSTAAEPTRAAMERHLTINDRTGDILHHPAFAGFAELIFPNPGAAASQDTPLAQIGSLLPYHTHVNTRDVVAALNRMIDDVRNGQVIFHSIYSEAEKQRDPSKARTGLFFFRGSPGAPFAVIAPGGGFSYVGSMHEGYPYAAEISKKGLNAFVLTYRVGQGGSAATEDLAAAVSYIFRHADRLAVSTRGYSLWGSSAGARMAAAIGTHGVARFGGEALPKPAAVVMAYTGHSDYSPNHPPTFAVVGERDGIAPPAAMERRVAALRAAGVRVEFRKYPHVGHGFGLGTGTSAHGWLQEAVRFWQSMRTPAGS